MLKPGGQVEGDEALEFYAKHTAQIEVTRKAMEAPSRWTGCFKEVKKVLSGEHWETPINTSYFMNSILILVLVLFCFPMQAFSCDMNANFQRFLTFIQPNPTEM